jgi:hypothetical protein
MTIELAGARRAPGQTLIALCSVLLLVAAALYFALFAIFRSTGHHAYDSGAAPTTVTLTAGKQYQLAVRGGRPALMSRGASADRPQCSWSTGSVAGQPLAVNPLPADARSVNVVATFVAPISDQVRITCAGWSAVFVDDSNDSAFDRGGLFLLLATMALTTGLALGLGVLFRRRRRDGDHLAAGLEQRAA